MPFLHVPELLESRGTIKYTLHRSFPLSDTEIEMARMGNKVGRLSCVMMMSSNGNIFRVTGHLCGEFTSHRWIPCTKASDVELWCFFFICAWINGRVNNREAGDLRRHRAHHDVTVMVDGKLPPLMLKLTHCCGLLMSYGGIDMGHYWPMWWFVSWRHLVITWTNVDQLGSVAFT